MALGCKFFVKSLVNANFRRKNGKYGEKSALTRRNFFDILLYCISMDKSLFSAESFHKKVQNPFKKCAKGRKFQRFIQNLTFDF